MREDLADEALARRLRAYFESGEPLIDTGAIARTAMEAKPPPAVRFAERSRLVLKLGAVAAVMAIAAVLGLLATQIRPIGDARRTPVLMPSESPTSPASTEPAAGSSTPGASPGESAWIEHVIEPDAREGIGFDVDGNDSLLVAVGAAGAQPSVWISGDGENWARADSVPPLPDGTAGYLVDVTRTRLGFVAVGWSSAGAGGSGESPLVWVSADGRIWSDGVLQAAPGTRLVAVTSGTDQTATVGISQGGVLAWTSSDGGRQWEPGGVPANASAVGALAWKGDRFVAAGTTSAAPASPAFWTSIDGVEWIAASGEFGTGSVTKLAVGEVGLVAVGNDGSDRAAVWLSEDGLAWSRAAAPATAGLIAVAHGPDELVATTSQAGTSTIWRSMDDARTWRLDDGFDPASGSVRALVAFQRRLVGFGDRDGAPIVWASR